MHSLRTVLIVLFGIITISCTLADTKDASHSEQSVKVDGIDTEKLIRFEEQSTEQVKGYKTFIVTNPKLGKFVLLSKTSKPQEKLAPDSVDKRIADFRGTLDEFMMERAESNDDNQKLKIVKSKKKPIFKKNVDSYLIPLN